MLDCLLPYDLGYRVIQNASPLLSVSDSLTLFELQGNVPLSKVLIALRPTFTLWHIIKKIYRNIFYIEMSGAKFCDKLYFEAQVEFSSLSNSEKSFHFFI